MPPHLRLGVVLLCVYSGDLAISPGLIWRFGQIDNLTPQHKTVDIEPYDKT